MCGLRGDASYWRQEMCGLRGDASYWKQEMCGLHGDASYWRQEMCGLRGLCFSNLTFAFFLNSGILFVCLVTVMLLHDDSNS